MTDFYSLMQGLEPWHWLSLSLALIVIELAFIGAYFLLAIGVAAAVVALVLFAVPALFWHAQLSLWAVLSIAAIAGWSIYKKANPSLDEDSDEPLLNNRAAQYIGRIFVLESDLSDGEDVQHKVDDSFWTLRARGDLKKGARVKVVDAKSTVLTVEAEA